MFLNKKFKKIYVFDILMKHGKLKRPKDNKILQIARIIQNPTKWTNCTKRTNNTNLISFDKNCEN